MPTGAEVLAIPGAHYHSYGKEPRPNRKLGHCTITAASARGRDNVLRKVLKL
jgi:5-(carboxyamino)imidazole ribonucleotide synthase